MAVTGTLEQIRTKVRRVTGRLSVNQLSDADLDNYINDFYVYDFPEHIKPWNLSTGESPLFPTTPTGDQVLIPGESAYIINPLKYRNIGPPFYVGGYEIDFYQDVRAFFEYFSQYRTVKTLTVGTGVTGPYAGTTSVTPVLDASVFISTLDAAGNTMTAYSNSVGTLTGDVTAGTINLTTGAVAGLTWTAAVPVGTDITIQTSSYVEGRPQAVLFYNLALMFYPVPDVAYRVSCSVDINPDALEAGDQPIVREWWNLIAYGAALKIFADNLDMESYQKADVLFEKQLRLVGRRTLAQLSTQRVETIYSLADYTSN